MQIRRAAALVGTGEIGYVISVLQKIAADGNGSVALLFEGKISGLLSEQAINNVHFTDGSPAVLEESP